MKVFISWSGEKSRDVAELIKKLLRVVNNIDAFMSNDDIRSGSMWFGKISDELAEANYGILVITEENKEAPWILFEAGALYKGLMHTSKIVPIIADNHIETLKNPLGSFHARRIEDNSMYSLVTDIQNEIATMDVKENNALKERFTYVWKDLLREYDEILLKYVKPTFDLSLMKSYIWQDNCEVDRVEENANVSEKSIAFQYSKATVTNYENFVMLSFVLDEPQDWSIYYQHDYSIKCTINMANITALTFQFKTLNNGIIDHNTITQKISFGQTNFNVKLSKGNLKKIKAAKELCFLVYNSDIKDGNCSFSVANLRIEK